MITIQQRPPGKLVSLAVAALPVIAASAIGTFATLPNIPGWYAALAKPSFTPPNWLFGPAWTTLYVLMAYAFYRVLRTDYTDRTLPVAAFLLQIALNAGWSVAFFGGRSPLAGLLVIVPLWLTILWTCVLFWKRDKLAGALFIPYLAWVSFAAALNFEVWRLNG
ncbi:MAG: TspO protein [Hyphomicrobiales bacterium]|nr:TspO protein [Hyphomicrobiales bacterium]